MSTLKGVDSFHINVQQGDSAIHLLVNYDETNPGVRTIEKAIMIDAGIGGPKWTKNIHDTLLEIPNLPSSSSVRWIVPGHQAGTSLQLDAIIITHWDIDHCAGLASLLQQDIDNTNRFDPDSWQPAFLKYGTPSGRSKPVTMVYAPYWDTPRPKKTGAHFSRFKEETDANGRYLNFYVPSRRKGKKRTLNATYEKVAQLIYDKTILGMEFFGGAKRV